MSSYVTTLENLLQCCACWQTKDMMTLKAASSCTRWWQKTKMKTLPLLICMKTRLLPTEVGGIAWCDHKMSSASSLSPYQAVCCTEHSELAVGTGHTSRHPPPPWPLLSLFLCLSLFCRDPPSPTPLSLSPWGAAASIVSVTGPQCWQSSRPSEDTSNPVPLRCC